MPHRKPHDNAKQPTDQLATIRETLTGILIAFIMAFVFRGFVIEGFVIPTGSMAPTLMGKHIRVRSDASGYDWAVGPWDYYNNNRGNPPTPKQGGQQTSTNGPRSRLVEVHDPMTGAQTGGQDLPLRSGDRVFVLKYLPKLHQPSRWDVVVFKNPATQENYIKRLIGLPGEQLALVDGDVFARPFVEGVTPLMGLDAWLENGWIVQRKDERTQRAVWQPVFDSRYTPRRPEPSYRSPWRAPEGEAAGWTGLGGSNASNTYRYDGPSSKWVTLEWSETVPISDRGAYNELPLGRFTGQPHVFPVSDIAASIDIVVDESLRFIVPKLEARGHDFHAKIIISRKTGMLDVGLSMGPHVPAGQDPPPSNTLDSAAIKAPKPGSTIRVEFWHVDQALWLFIDGKLVCGGPEKGAYALTPAQRIKAATGQQLEALLDDPRSGNGRTDAGVLARTDLFRRPRFAWTFSSNAPIEISRVTMQRDLHYQVAGRGPTLGGHPDHFPTLSPDEFFMCGDNSPNSKDSRLWILGDGGPDPWIASQVNPGVPSTSIRDLDAAQRIDLLASVGKVHRDLLIGKAFVVYFPAPFKLGRLPVPDTGRVRWIW